MTETVSGRAGLERLLALEMSDRAGLDEDAVDRLVARGVETVAGFVGLAQGSPAAVGEELGVDPEALVELVAAAAEEFLTPEERGALIDWQAPDAALAEEDLAGPALLEWRENQTLTLEGESLAEDLDQSLVPRKALEPLPPIRDQGGRFTCTAFATVAVLEVQLLLQGLELDLSEQFLYWRTKNNDVGIYPDTPFSLLRFAFGSAVTGGVCLDHLWPYHLDYRGYVQERNTGPTDPQAVPDAATRRMEDVESFTGTAVVNDARRSLARHKPVAVTLRVAPPFLRNGAFRLGEPIPLPSSQEVAAGLRLHSVALVGYHDGPGLGGGYFRLRNSIGSSWGKGGYGLLPYAYLRSYGVEAWTGRPA